MFVKSVILRCFSFYFYFFFFLWVCYRERRWSTSSLHVIQVKAVSPCTALHVICNRKHFVNTRDDARSRDCIAWPAMRVPSIVGQTRDCLLANATVHDHLFNPFPYRVSRWRELSIIARDISNCNKARLSSFFYIMEITDISFIAVVDHDRILSCVCVCVCVYMYVYTSIKLWTRNEIRQERNEIITKWNCTTTHTYICNWPAL